MYVVIVNRAPTINSEKQWTILITLNWETNGIVSESVAVAACARLIEENKEIECKVQQLFDSK